MRVEMFTFLVAGAICLGGALGVVLFRNPVHNALSLVATLFGVAVLFIAQEAYFLAAIQVIVYAGAIVVLFLFVIMLLGVDRREAERPDPIPGQRVAAIVVGVAILGLSLVALLAGTQRVTGAPSVLGPLSDDSTDIVRLGRVIFTDYIFVFEITAVLLTVAVIGAVVLARRAGDPIDVDEFPEGTAVERLGLDELDRFDDEAFDDEALDGDVAVGSHAAGSDAAGSDRGPAELVTDSGTDDGGAR
jgi:NADH-quinone oxidoreductase subunit J